MTDKLTNIGTELHVSAALPATDNVAGYEALTFTEVLGVATVPEFGPVYEMVTANDVKDGVTQKAHGGVDYGGGSVSYRIIEADAGQGIFKSAMAAQDYVSIKIVRATGLIEYFKGLVLSNRTS